MFDDLEDALPAEETPPDPSEPHGGLVRASDLVEDPEALDQGDFEPSEEGLSYKGFPIISTRDWPDDHATLHGNRPRRFYVRSLSGQVGMVPFEGSQVVWPWEQAWKQDLYRPEVESFLKEPDSKKKK